MPGLRDPMHWLVLVIVLVLVFGATRLPVIAKSLGQSMKIFKKEMKDLRDDDAPATPAKKTDEASRDDDTSAR